MLLRFGIASLVLAVALVLSAPVSGAALPQTADEVVTLQAQSALTLTLTMKDGAIYQVPMVLAIETVHGPEAATVEITEVTVDHRNNYLVEVEKFGPVTATVQLAGEGALTDTAPITAPTAGPIPVTATGRGRLNVRSGPGTEYAVVRQVAAGDKLLVVGRNADGSWLELEDGGWIAAFLVEGELDAIPTMTPTATPRPTETPQPTATPAPQPTATPIPPSPTPTEVAFRSGGLGLTLEEMEALYGPASGTSAYATFDNERLYAMFHFHTGRVFQMGEDFVEGFFPDKSVARDYARRYFPADAELVEIYPVPDYGEAQLMYSPSLAQAFPDVDYYPNAEPGQFVVLYLVRDGDVLTLDIATGNNP